jgi:hypothetical protein
MEQINKVTNEYWNRKTLEKIYDYPSPLLEAMSKATPENPYKPNEGWVTAKGVTKQDG